MTSKLNVFDHATKDYKRHREYKRGKWVNDGLIGMPKHVIWKLESCAHKWAESKVYGSGAICLDCSCSIGTYNNYRNHIGKQLVNRLQGLLQ